MYWWLNDSSLKNILCDGLCLASAVVLRPGIMRAGTHWSLCVALFSNQAKRPCGPVIPCAFCPVPSRVPLMCPSPVFCPSPHFHVLSSFPNCVSAVPTSPNPVNSWECSQKVDSGKQLFGTHLWRPGIFYKAPRLFMLSLNTTSFSTDRKVL